ncbi:carbapenem biosynthesis protein CpmH [Photorhabdus laumondii]|uniref:carbapenem biosynthesis protein CpmH n=1 Tax=Photorhabdus laumondii TaxID=2218628 RepID=UPI0025AF665E|nr:carbapenem biosynthesis protein CpmH [Photorhabdus laumondii]
MKLFLFFFFVFLSFFCHSGENESFRKKIQKKIDDKILLCLGETEWPVSINENSIWVNANMESLVDAGLVKLDFKRGKNKLWNLTKLGKKEFNKNGDFCYGRMMLKDILSITYINKKRGFIVFNYYVHLLPEWAKSKSIRFAYSYLDNIITGIDNEKYQIEFEKSDTGVIKIISDPVQLEILY